MPSQLDIAREKRAELDRARRKLNDDIAEMDEKIGGLMANEEAIRIRLAPDDPDGLVTPAEAVSSRVRPIKEQLAVSDGD